MKKVYCVFGQVTDNYTYAYNELIKIFDTEDKAVRYILENEGILLAETGFSNISYDGMDLE